MNQTQNQPEYITVTIKDWQHFLTNEPFKMKIVEQLKSMTFENLLEKYLLGKGRNEEVKQKRYFTLL